MNYNTIAQFILQFHAVSNLLDAVSNLLGHFSSLVQHGFFSFRLASKYNMKLLWKKNFHDLFMENERSYSHLLAKMNALEVSSPIECLHFISGQKYPVFYCFLELLTELQEFVRKVPGKWLIWIPIFTFLLEILLTF